MTSEINDILLEITQYCGENQIRVSFTQYGSKRNSIEETTEMGDRVVQIQIGDKNDEYLYNLLSDFLVSLKG